MSLSLTEVAAFTNRTHVKNLVDNVLLKSELLSRFDKMKKHYDGGTSIAQEITVNDNDKANNQLITGAEPFNFTQTESLNTAQYEWTNMVQGLILDVISLAKCNGSAAQLRLAASRVKHCENVMFDKMSDMLFSDGSESTGVLDTNQLNGLRLLLSTSETFGGIAVADVPTWVSVVKENSSTVRALSDNLINQAILDATNGNMGPKVLVAGRSVMGKVRSLIQPSLITYSEESAKYGFKTFTYNEMPVILDTHVWDSSTNGKLLLLDTDSLFLGVHKDLDFKMDYWDKIHTAAIAQWVWHWMGTLVCSQRRTNALITDIQIA